MLAVEEMKKMRLSPFYFVKLMWKLEPQDKDEVFVKGEHITWQQCEILKAVEEGINGGKKRISVRSGHGVGKSCVLAWLVLWYLFTRPHCQIPCTAPTSDQIYDVLWKEIAKWLKKMPEDIQSYFQWTTNYIRFSESPETWFARAKTARKESPEALAGIHADDVMMIVDEASGIPEEIFNVAEGALTDENILVILISNPTRLIGYFYDTHNKDSDAWTCLNFNSLESPIVDNKFVNRIIEKHGEGSDEHRVRVLGEFPHEDAIDDKGYVPLLKEDDLGITIDNNFDNNKNIRLGIDPSGQGKDKTAFVIRDAFKAKVVGLEKLSTPKSIAQKAMSIAHMYNIKPENIFVDNFGAGANVAQELAMARFRCRPVNVGEQGLEKDRFLNLRAEAFWGLREWLKKGGELIANEAWKELLTIRYRPNLAGKIQIMSKLDMKRDGYKSPDFADALMLTFTTPENNYEDEIIDEDFDPYSPI